MDPHLALTGLSKAFGQTRAADDVSLEARQGEFLALLGPSGCGKTTVMRMIAGIVAPDAGSIRLGARCLDALPPEQRGVGLVFQSYALFPHMSVADNVAFGLKMRGMSRATRAPRIKAALELVELGDLAARLPKALSGGQQQRVALARAIAIEPDLLLLDEPLSNLDAKLREQLRVELKRLQRRLGLTAIHVTHDQSEALALADRIIVMNRGRIVETGAPTELYRRPRHRFTAEFLGVTNLAPVEVAGASARLRNGATLAVSGAAHAAGRALASLRPEDLALVADAEGEAMIDDIVFHGGETEFWVTAPQLELVGQARLRIRLAGLAAEALRPGARVRLVLPAQAHLVEDRGAEA